MPEKNNRTYTQIKSTICDLKEFLAEVEPSTEVQIKGSFKYAGVGMTVLYGPGAEAGCGGGCFGCMGCDSTARVAMPSFDEAINPAPLTSEQG